MSAAIHYKLKSAKDYDTYRFDGAGIPVWELKNEIIERKRLGKSDDFDLVILNAQTNEEYADDSSIIPRNTSVVVKRVPVARGARPKRASTNSAYIPQSMVSTLQNPTAQTGSKEEDQRISKMMNESTSHWVHTQQQSQQQGHQVRRVVRPKGPNPLPPPTYTCFRCGQPGHYINYCPTNEDPTFDRPRIKKTTGIPRAFLRTVDPHLLDNPATAIMVTSEGAAVIATPNESEWERVTAERHLHPQIPSELKCAVCEDLLRSPRRLGCCKTVCCEDCLQQHDDSEADGKQVVCPSCRRVTALQSVTVAEDVQEKLTAYLNSTIATTVPPPSVHQEAIKQQPQERPLPPAHTTRTTHYTADRQQQQQRQPRQEYSPTRRRRSSRSPQRYRDPGDTRDANSGGGGGRYYRDNRRDDRRDHRTR